MKNFILTILIIVIWSSSTIAMTGDVEKQIPAPGSCLTGLTFDGKHIWGVDRKSDKIYKIDPADGKIINSFTSPGYFPTGLAWDGEHLWVSDLDFTNTSTESYSGKIYQVCPKSGKTLSVIMSPGADPMGLAWDGQYLWVSDNKDDMIYQISPDDGTTISSFKAPASNPGGMTWDGNYLWIADRAQDEIYRVHPTKGIVVMIIDAPGPYAWGLAWNGEKLLNTDYQTDKISEIKIFDKEPYKRTNERFEDIEFTNDIINFGPGSLTNIDLYFAEPGNRSNQEIVEITYPVKPKDFLTDKWGQKVAHFNFKNIKAGSRISPVIKVKAKIYEVRYNVFPEK
ncbi:MAG: transglutaminase, partial [Calditrichia bacterium]|nr:transglutaminase [Calditrichia bacterium]